MTPHKTISSRLPVTTSSKALLKILLIVVTAGVGYGQNPTPAPAPPAQQPTAPTAPPPQNAPPAQPATPATAPLSLDDVTRLALAQASAFQQAQINERLAAEDVRQAQLAFLPRLTSPSTFIYTSPEIGVPATTPRTPSPNTRRSSASPGNWISRGGCGPRSGATAPCWKRRMPEPRPRAARSCRRRPRLITGSRSPRPGGVQQN